MELWEVCILLMLGIMCGIAMKDFCIETVKMLFKQIKK